MSFGTNRNIFLSILFICLIFWIMKKSKIVNKKKAIGIAAIICLVLEGISTPFGAIRIIFWGIFFICLIFWIMKKSKIVNKKRVIRVAVIICVVLESISTSFPVENLFWGFECPDEVLKYYHGVEADDIIVGNNSSMAIYSKGSNSSGFLIIPRSEKGYQIPNFRSRKMVYPKAGQHGSFMVFNVLNTEDYYVVGIITSEAEKINVTDSNGKNVKTITSEMGDTGYKSVSFYSFVENFTKEYYFIVNGEKVMVSN